MSETIPPPDFDGLATNEDRRIWAEKMRLPLQEEERQPRANELSPEDRVRLLPIFEDHLARIPEEERRRQDQAAEERRLADQREEDELRVFAETLGPEYTDPYRVFEVRALRAMKDAAERAVKQSREEILSRTVQVHRRRLERYAILLGPYEFMEQDGAVHLCGVVYFSNLLPPRRLAARIQLSPRQRTVFLEVFQPGGIGTADHSKLKLKRPEDLRDLKTRILQKIRDAVGPVPMATVRAMVRIANKTLTVYASSDLAPAEGGPSQS